MPILDFSLANPKIATYLNGTSEVAPVGEMVYVHTHFVANNFLSQIESLVLQADLALQTNPKKKGVAQKLVSLSEKFAALTGPMNDDRAAQMLVVLREIYQTCNRILNVTTPKNP